MKDMRLQFSETSHRFFAIDFIYVERLLWLLLPPAAIFFLLSPLFLNGQHLRLRCWACFGKRLRPWIFACFLASAITLSAFGTGAACCVIWSSLGCVFFGSLTTRLKLRQFDTADLLTRHYETVHGVSASLARKCSHAFE